MLHHGLVVEDGPCQQMREERHEQSVVHEVPLILTLIVEIDANEVHQLGDREEGDAQRQHDVQEGDVQPRELVQVADEEIHVLEPAEQAQVE